MSIRQIEPFSMDWKPLHRAAPDWFRNAKFGLFFHWGPYTVPAFGNEWYSRNMYEKGHPHNQYHEEHYGKLDTFGYKDFYDAFKGENFRAGDWAELVVRSGARYAGPATEHADNFALWDSKVNPVNAVNYGPKRDIIKEFAAAVRDKDLHFIATFHHHWLWGWFMSSDPNADVYFPESERFYGKSVPFEAKRYIPWCMPDEAFNRDWLQKMIEVIDAYHPDLVYLDGRAMIVSEARRYELLQHYYNRPGARSDTIITYKETDFPEGTGITDLECGRFNEVQPFVWQTDDRLEALPTWSHVQNPKYKSAGVVIHKLCDVVSKNGNLLLNVGPKADGTFEDEARATLYEVGDWLQSYGEAIYDTRPFTVYGEGPFADQMEAQVNNHLFHIDESFTADDVRYTTNGHVVYAILLGNPAKLQIHLAKLGEGAGLASKQVHRVEMLVPGNRQELQWNRSSSALTVQLHGPMPSMHANVLRIEYI